MDRASCSRSSIAEGVKADSIPPEKGRLPIPLSYPILSVTSRVSSVPSPSLTPHIMSKWQHIPGGYNGRDFVKLVFQEGLWNFQGMLRDIMNVCLWHPLVCVWHKLIKSIHDTSQLYLLDNIIFIYFKWLIIQPWLALTIFTYDNPWCVFVINKYIKPLYVTRQL